MEFRSCARGRQWCCIIHYYWWTASIKPRLLCRLCFLRAFPFISLIDPATVFLNSRTITSVVQRPRKTFTPPIKIVGSIHTEENSTTLRQQQEKRDSKLLREKTWSTKPTGKSDNHSQQPSLSYLTQKPTQLKHQPSST